jgi:hypothetical protein
LAITPSTPISSEELRMANTNYPNSSPLQLRGGCISHQSPLLSTERSRNAAPIHAIGYLSCTRYINQYCSTPREILTSYFTALSQSLIIKR